MMQDSKLTNDSDPDTDSDNDIMARSYMFTVHDPCKMFSKQVRWYTSVQIASSRDNVHGRASFRFKIGTHLGLRSMT